MKLTKVTRSSLSETFVETELEREYFGMIVLALFVAALCTTWGGSIEKTGRAKGNEARIQIRTLGNAVESFREEHQRFPSSLLELVNPPSGKAFLTERPIDPWGNPYLYNNVHTIELQSLGPDALLGTIDDVLYY